MSEATLPEELVNEILKHAIQAHPDTFLGPSRDRASFHRPNAPPSPLGSSHLLLVSKRWLRIGTPLLYTSLWISADAHTQTLLHIFRGNPALGALVLDLRLDGGFGSELHDVVLSMPNVRNVYLSWGLGQGHSMVGLWDTMSVLRPIKLWLGPHGDVMKEGLEAAGLTSLLAACISGRWNSLEYVHLEHWYPLFRIIVEALQHAPALKVLSVHAEDIYNWSWLADRLSFLDNEALQTVYCRSPDSPKETRRMLEKGGVKKRIIDRLTLIGEDEL